MKARIIHNSHKNGHDRNAYGIAAGTLKGNFRGLVNQKGHRN